MNFGKSLKLFGIPSLNHHKRYENRETADYHGLSLCDVILRTINHFIILIIGPESVRTPQ